MATALNPVVIKHTELTALGTPAAGDTTGNTVPNSGSKTVLYVECGATPRTLTVNFARTVDGQPITAKVHNLAANFKGFLKLGPVRDYGQIVSVVPSHAEVLVKSFELA